MIKLRRILTVIAQALACVAAGAVGLTAIANVVEVAARYLFNAPLNWGSDLSAFALCACVFLALPEVTRRHGHASITLLPDQMSEARARSYRAVICLLSGVLCLVVAWFAFEVTAEQHDRGVLTTTANQIPRWWLTASIAAGLALTAVNFVVFATATGEPIGEHAE